MNMRNDRFRFAIANAIERGVGETAEADPQVLIRTVLKQQDSSRQGPKKSWASLF